MAVHSRAKRLLMRMRIATTAGKKQQANNICTGRDLRYPWVIVCVAALPVVKR